PEPWTGGSWLSASPTMCSMSPGSPEQYTSVGSTTVVSPPRSTVTLLLSGREAELELSAELASSSESEASESSESAASASSSGSSALSLAESSEGSLSAAGSEVAEPGEAGSSEPVAVQAATAARTAAQRTRVGVDRFTALSKRSDDRSATAPG